MRGEFGRANRLPAKWPSLVRGLKNEQADICFADAEITLGDWRACVDQYKDDPRALIFLDPPYFNSFNQEYFGYGGLKYNEAGEIADITQLFVEMFRYLESSAATIVVITNSCAIFDYLFATFLECRYPKRYGSTVKNREGAYVQKSTHHLVLLGGGQPQ